MEKKPCKWLNCLIGVTVMAQLPRGSSPASLHTRAAEEAGLIRGEEPPDRYHRTIPYIPGHRVPGLCGGGMVSCGQPALGGCVWTQDSPGQLPLAGARKSHHLRFQGGSRCRVSRELTHLGCRAAGSLGRCGHWQTSGTGPQHGVLQGESLQASHRSQYTRFPECSMVPLPAHHPPAACRKCIPAWFGSPSLLALPLFIPIKSNWSTFPSPT